MKHTNDHLDALVALALILAVLTFCKSMKQYQDASVADLAQALGVAK